MKVIIDTNILVSVAIAGGKPESIITWIIAESNYQWIVSEDILVEYGEVLARSKLKLTDAKREKWLTLIRDFTTLIAVSIKVDFPRDRKDAKFLECAIAANADFLITGDRDFTEVQMIGNTSIISAALFADLIMKYAQNGK